MVPARVLYRISLCFLSNIGVGINCIGVCSLKGFLKVWDYAPRLSLLQSRIKKHSILGPEPYSN